MDWVPEYSTEETTEILLRWAGGDPAALEQLMPRVYNELRRLARSLSPHSHTLRPTVLVHELYVRLIDASRVEVKDRGHFMAVAAKAMRRIAIDGARAALTEKRGGNLKIETFDRELPGATPDEVIVRLNEALDTLEKTDPRKAAVVEMRFFGGMEMPEVAATLNVSLATAERDWKFARSWLYKTLTVG
jgi:RNA polymerase sigma factor (TIGR02999 family)